ncbi:O-linked N-acetylglucosamine transferase, SPINDLY family protein [Pseudanabaena sp. UWO310]|uniref:O-linked N-acetylglucosamine transferase, SPINDLY family protein n=1 Tax=Pseudanabaena sp. UWO310 TaxID=2480795 RepID=UPI001CC214A0|nr:O-linked N-acetylglucosamine transferase, SPINDLY family protein [Pseudanabaena sp. UWO310]
MTNWQDLLLNNNYKQIAEFYEKEIELYPDIEESYYYLGLALFLQKKHESAKDIWALGLKKSKAEDLYNQKLSDILEQEACRQELLHSYQGAWEIRQNIRQLKPDNFDNLVCLCIISIRLKTFSIDTVRELGLVDLHKLTSDLDVNDEAILKLIVNVSYSPILLEEEIIGFISHWSSFVRDEENCIEYLLYLATKFKFDLALKIIDVCQKISPSNIKILVCLTSIYISNNKYTQGIEIARSALLVFSQNLLDKTASNYLLLYTLLSAGGKWQEVETIFKNLQSLLSEIVDQNLLDISSLYLNSISNTCFSAPYLQDAPQVNRDIQNQSMNLFQANVRHSHPILAKRFHTDHLARRENLKHNKLRIGYLAGSLRKHSVGWLARSLFQHFDRDSFEIYGYFPNYQLGVDFLEEWYISRMHKVYREGIDYWGNHFMVADQINRDEIDVLVDTESLTSSIGIEILALKPAPLQVTWLGWDASGLPAMDYYIADPYVLPENAQEYYSEKIWRLPQTYIATDGFESYITSLRRCDLNIPDDAIIYFSSQKSYKRHPKIVRAQLQIIKQVPNSYFLIKGLADENLLQNFFYELATSEGVDLDQLKFLPFSSSEAEHRANLAIVDVVLDTYPYNGATTTMETLWFGIPMVTLVGEQFSARNSYAMMINAGVTEGIAWNFQEYVEWGIRFGTESPLRQDVAWKLRQSRKTSPLWDGRQFAKEMENAYRQMWEIYNGKK